MAFSAPSGGIITQTGRDLNFSGLAGNAGVTRTVDDGITYYNFGQNRLFVTGTVFHNPETEVLIFSHDGNGTAQPCLYIERPLDNNGNNTAWSLAADGNLVFTRSGHPFLVGDAVAITGTGTLDNISFRVIAVSGSNVTIDSNKNTAIPAVNGASWLKACYNYGSEVTVLGRTRFSTGTGLYFTGTAPSNYQQNDSGISVNTGGLLWARGGTIVTHRVATLARVNIDGLTIFGTRTVDTRTPVALGILRNFEIYNYDINLENWQYLQDKGFILRSAGLIEQLGATSPYREFELRNFDVSKNANEYDIGHSADARFCHKDWIITNSANGSNVKGLWRATTGTDSQKGNTFVKKEVSIKTVDTTNTPISAVKVYCIDTPSPYAKNVTYPDPTSTNYFSQPTLSLGVLNPNGTVTYNYTVPITYAYTTNLSGNTPTFKVTTATQMLERLATDSTALSANGGPYNIPSYSGNYWRETDGAAPAYSDWDTNRFGGFYKVDRRSNSNTDADDFTFKFCSYRHALTFTVQTLKGFDVLQVNWVLFNDSTITQTDKTIVDAYTTIDTPEKFYDRAKSYLYDNFAGQTSTLVTRNGNVVNVGNYNVTIDTLAANAFALSGSTFTLKADNFVGTIQTTGTLALSNGAFNTDPRYIALTLDGASIAIYDNVAALRYYTNADQNITLPLSSTGLWTYKYAKYGYKLGQGSFTVNGGTINISPISIPDVYVLETFAYNTSAYSSFDTTQKIYDYLSYYRTTSAGLGYGDLNLYAPTLDIGSNNIILFDSASPAFSYDGSTITLNSLNLSGADITTTGTISLSGNSAISNIELTTDVLDQTPADLTNVTINGILKYNTESPASITYTNTTVDTVVNDGTATVLIQRINSSINNDTDPEIDNYAPTIINITPDGGSVAIYDDSTVRQYFITTTSTVVLPFDASGAWSYKVAKYGFHLIEQPFTVSPAVGATINITPNYIPDNFIDALVANVANYTDLNNASEIHDYLMYFQTLSSGINYGDLESESFGTITFTNSLALSADASSMVSLSGTTVVLKSTYLTDDIVLVSTNGNITQHSGNTISDGIKLRANNLDSEIYFNTVDSITFFPTASARDNNTDGNITLTSATIYRFKYGSTVSGITFTNYAYARVTVGGATLLVATPIALGTNTIDFGVTGNLQTLNNNLRIVNDGVKKSSILVPHTTTI